MDKNTYFVNSHKRIETIKQTKPISLIVIPEIFLQIYSNQVQVILDPEIETHLRSQTQNSFRLKFIEYLPRILETIYRGGYILSLSRHEQALYYKDNHILYFQKLRSHLRDQDLVFGINYLKRFGVHLADNLPLLTNFIHSVSLSMMIRQKMQTITYFLQKNRKKSFLSPQEKIVTQPLSNNLVSNDFLFTDSLETLFEYPRYLYKKWRLYRRGFAIINTLLFLSISHSIVGYSDRVNQIKTIQSTMLSLTKEQEHLAETFNIFTQWQQTQKKVNFDFAHVMVKQWQHKIVITTLDWSPSQTAYTVLFHPDHQQEIESFLDWIESQHPQIQILEKDITHGSLQLSHSNS